MGWNTMQYYGSDHIWFEMKKINEPNKTNKNIWYHPIKTKTSTVPRDMKLQSST